MTREHHFVDVLESSPQAKELAQTEAIPRCSRFLRDPPQGVLRFIDERIDDLVPRFQKAHVAVVKVA